MIVANYILFSIIALASGITFQLGWPAVGMALAIIALPSFVAMVNSYIDE